MSERTLTDLGFPKVIDALVERCRTDPGRRRALSRPFLDNVSAVHDALRLVEEARRLLAEPLSLPVTGVAELAEVLQRAEKGAMLEPRELIAITHTLFAFEHTTEALEVRRESLPMLAQIGRRIPQLERLATRLDRCFEPSGEISDRASPELRDARERTRGLHRSIKARLDKLLHDEKFVTHLREPYFSVRNDRYVLPVLTQERAAVPGIVHNASQSGQTLFVEPQELIGLGNELAIAQSVVLEEERKVLQDLSNAVGRVAGDILRGVEACAELDEAEAAARLANALDALGPELELEDGAIDLKGLRHPLLVLKGATVVGNDVLLSGQTRALVVSGPNAGGKTVTLTAVGLAALMVRAGLPIPADPGSRVPLFRSIHSAIGDAQDLARGLSTFSAHVVELKDILAVSGRGALVLIDEIAADTDPREGAAIAIAVLEELIARGAVALVTTHLEELKALAHLDQRFVNARVGFDAKKMAPTYRLHLGSAGASSAIEIASRMGLPESVCGRARALALNAGGPLAQALAAAEQEHQRLSEALEEAKRETAAARAERAKLDEERRTFERARNEEELKFRDALKGELAFAKSQIGELVTQIKAQRSAEAAARAEREVAERLAEQERAARTVQRALSGEPAPTAPATLRVGARVRHAELDTEMEIVALTGDVAVVAAGPLRMKVPVSLLTAPRAAPAKPRFPSADKQKEQLAKAEQAASKPLALSSSTCDVRGLRADEALRSVDQFLDRVMQEGQEHALIIHGHGSGALKQSIRGHLDASAYVSGYRPGDGTEGGDGVTVVTLKG